MSNEPTKDTDRWKIGKSNLLYNLVYLLVALTVSYLFNLTFLAAVLWCLPLVPAWWLLKKRLRRDEKPAQLYWVFFTTGPHSGDWV